MSVQYYPNGIGGYPPGDFLDTCKPLQTSGNIWYVSSLVGIDAVAPAGLNREKPLATVAQAVTNAIDEDIIVFLPGHTQTLTTVQALAKSLTLIGEGTISDKPAVSFAMNAAANSIFSATVAGVEFRNLYFPQNLQANASPKVAFTGSGTDGLVRGCYFDCGATDTGAAISIGASRSRIESTILISTATTRAAQPSLAIRATPGAYTGLVLKDVVVSAGTVGFSNFSAVDFSQAVVTRLRAEGLSLLLGADADFGSASTGRVNVQLATGGSRVQW
jgi:hypothetical protein